jgi:serine/threonine protein kinase/formylglycine-generating enzyme required for sulfatase activity
MDRTPEEIRGEIQKIEELRSSLQKELEESRKQRGHHSPLVLAGRYEILRKLNHGGLGSVYQAKDITFGERRFVAIKVLYATPCSDEAIEEFRREFLLASQLQHPNICAAYEIAEDEQRHMQFLVMEYLHGNSLQQLLHQRNKFGVTVALPIIFQMAAALDYTHSQRILHLDVNPANFIMLTSGLTKLIDFGLARQLPAEMPYLELSNLFGTPPYLAPEQINARHPIACAATDQWALGVSIYQMLSGSLPFKAESPERVREQIVHDDPPRISELPDAPWEILARALSKQPEHRFSSCQEMVDALQNASMGRRLVPSLPNGVTSATLQTQPGLGQSTTLQVQASRQDGNGPHDVVDINALLDTLEPNQRGQASTRHMSVAIEEHLAPAATGSDQMATANLSDSARLTGAPGSCPTHIHVPPPARARPAQVGQRPSPARAVPIYNSPSPTQVPPSIPAERWPHAELNDVTLSKRRARRKKIIAASLILFLVLLIYSTKLLIPWLRGMPKEEEANRVVTPAVPVAKEPGTIAKKPGTTVAKPVKLDMPGGIPVDIWTSCWNKEQGWFDFTVASWEKVGTANIIKYAKIYQTWYAKKRGLPVESQFMAGGEMFAMILLPPGKFWQGQNPDEQVVKQEWPRHKVLVNQPFWLGKYEVTQQQWYAITKQKPWLLRHIVKDSPWLQQQFIKDQGGHAASCISFDDIHEKFLPRLGKLFSLPTEAQWEYACRAGNCATFYWGNENAPNMYEWYLGNASNAGERYAHAVGGKQPNGWGLHDMCGNLSEWCRDWFRDYTEAELTNPVGPADGQARIYRSGSWSDINYRPAARFYSSPRSRYLFLGFRLCRQVTKDS